MTLTYTRQSSFSDGDTITAALFNDEYNQLVNAFAYSATSSLTGHQHDGTAAEGGNVHTIGDLDFLNKIVADSTNNRWGVFVEVSSAAVEQIRIQDGAIVPVTDNDIDLGTSSLEFKDAYFDGTITTDGLTVSSTTNLDGAIQVDNTITVGVDDTGYDVKFFGDTASAYMLWDTSADDLVLAGAAGLDIAGDIDVDGTANLDVVDIDGATQADGTITVGVDDTGYDVKFFGATSGAYMLWDESADDLKLVGAAGLTVAGDADIDGTTNLDAVDIDGAVQADGTITVGVDDTGYDVKFFGATASAYMLWDESADDLILAGAARVVVPASGLVIGSTAVSSTAAELNLLDGLDRGSILYGNASSVTTVLGQGSADQVLTSDGTDISWEDASGGGISGLTGLVENDSIWLGNDPTSTTDTAQYNVAVGTTAMDAITTGDGNVALGYGAMTAGTTCEDSVAIGYNALAAQTGNGDNTAVGDLALTVTTGSNNVAIGSSAGVANTTGSQNIFIGKVAGATSTTVNDNVAIGHQALTNNAAAGNTAVGARALKANTTGSTNTAVGKDALLAMTTGSGSTAVGDRTLDANTTGNYNTAVGSLALSSNTTASYNNAFGYNCLAACTTGAYNDAFGYICLDSLTTGSSNTAFGYNVLTALTTGGTNTAFGSGAAAAVTTASHNTALGSNAYVSGTGAQNIAIGRNCMYATVTGDDNVGIGTYSFTTLTGGSDNIAIGTYCLDALTTGSNNVGIGYAALSDVTTSSGNTAVGRNALEKNTNTNNTAVGYYALGANTTGTSNTGIGYEAMDSCTTGSYNTAVGYNAGTAVSTGAENVLIGSNAGASLSTGSYNVIIGRYSGQGETAGTALTTGSRNTMVGRYVDTSIAAGVDQNVFGYNVSGSADNTFTFGTATTDTTCTNGGTTWSAPSDIRLKEDIQDEVVGLDFINELRPVTFRWKKEKDVPEDMATYSEGSEERVMNGKYNHGFVAQEVKEVIDNHSEIKDGFDMWSEDDADGRQRIGETALIPMLVKSIQELSAEVEELKNKAHDKCEE